MTGGGGSIESGEKPGRRWRAARSPVNKTRRAPCCGAGGSRRTFGDGEGALVDNLLLLAIGAVGWGLSLATYRLFARRVSWPMGALHVDLPAVPVVIGLFALLAGIGFAAARGSETGGVVIVVSGLLLAVFWTGFLRVGSQVSLLLAPAAAMLLILGWLAGPLP